jgi:hypothetical protein
MIVALIMKCNLLQHHGPNATATAKDPSIQCTASMIDDLDRVTAILILCIQPFGPYV